jgi:DNA-binding TFAR19-related protein (PDSD5 family)
MPHHQPPNTRRMEFLLSDEAYERFHRLHLARGFRTKAETLEALIVTAELDSKIDPAALERIETKLDQALRFLEDLS